MAEKKGDHWELKDEMGPSDEQSTLERRRGPARGGRVAHAGIDAFKSKSELYEDAKQAVFRAAPL